VKGDRADRRSRRTRRLVADALIALMLEKRYDRITVQEIIDRADVGRSTFYAHYRDKDDVLVGEFERVLDTFHLELDPDGGDGAGGQQLLPSLSLFRHVQEQYKLYLALVRGGAVDLHYETGYRYLSARVTQQLSARVGDERALAVPLPILANHVAGTFLSLLRWWLEHQMPYSPERMHEIFQQLVLPTVGSIVPRAGARRTSALVPPTG
jgi:AcrR family transcriptional regulator